LKAAKISAVNLEDADFSGADLTESTWVAVNVTGANFEDTTTTDARSLAVDWSKAKVPPDLIPESLPITPWVPALIAGMVLLIVITVTILIVSLKRKKTD